ncbi:hypothetical protein [Nocardia sp. CC227C]|uniref:hypothetical protein n=1 Tax=Nocardia sp. CC227C TaxID=3044562 RepID=UPI0035567D5F
MQTDPVLAGSANAYDYCNGDPINSLDLTGRNPAAGAAGGFAVGGPLGALVGAAAGTALLYGAAFLADQAAEATVNHQNNDRDTSESADSTGERSIDWEHISSRHREGGSEVDDDASRWTVKDKENGKLIDRALKTNGRNNTPDKDGNPRPGKIYEWDAGKKVGESGPARGREDLTGIRALSTRRGT